MHIKTKTQTQDQQYPEDKVWTEQSNNLTTSVSDSEMRLVIYKQRQKKWERITTITTTKNTRTTENRRKKRKTEGEKRIKMIVMMNMMIMAGKKRLKEIEIERQSHHF